MRLPSACWSISLFAAAALFAAPPAPVKTYTIDNCVNAFDEARTFKNGDGQAFWFADAHFTPDQRTIKLSIMPPGAVSHPPHHHPEDEFFLVLEGEAEFYLDGRTRKVGPMTSLYAPSNVMHGLRNVGSTTLKYLVIKPELPR